MESMSTPHQITSTPDTFPPLQPSESTVATAKPPTRQITGHKWVVLENDSGWGYHHHVELVIISPEGESETFLLNEKFHEELLVPYLKKKDVGDWRMLTGEKPKPPEPAPLVELVSGYQSGNKTTSPASVDLTQATAFVNHHTQPKELPIEGFAPLGNHSPSMGTPSPSTLDSEKYAGLSNIFSGININGDHLLLPIFTWPSKDPGAISFHPRTKTEIFDSRDRATRSSSSNSESNKDGSSSSNLGISGQRTGSKASASNKTQSSTSMSSDDREGISITMIRKVQVVRTWRSLPLHPQFVEHCKMAKLAVSNGPVDIIAQGKEGHDLYGCSAARQTTHGGALWETTSVTSSSRSAADAGGVSWDATIIGNVGLHNFGAKVEADLGSQALEAKKVSSATLRELRTAGHRGGRFTSRSAFEATLENPESWEIVEQKQLVPVEDILLNLVTRDQNALVGDLLFCIASYLAQSTYGGAKDVATRMLDRLIKYQDDFDPKLQVCLEVHRGTGKHFIPKVLEIGRSIDDLEALRILSNMKKDRELSAGFNLLHKACERGDLETVRLLVNSNTPVDVKVTAGQNPLHIACKAGHLEIVRLLLDRGAAIEEKDMGGMKPLHMACNAGHLEVVRLLVERGAAVKENDMGEMNPLHMACKTDAGNLGMVQFLINNGASESVIQEIEEGKSLLYVVGDTGQPSKIFQWSVDSDPTAILDFKNKEGDTLLHIASWWGYLVTVRMLVEHKANLEAKNDVGMTPLHIACWSGELQVVEFLIESKANLDAKGSKGSWGTPLHAALAFQHMPIIEVLVKNGAPVETTNDWGLTPLQYASHYGQMDAVRFLVANGANIQAGTKALNTPLKLAMDNRQHGSALPNTSYKEVVAFLNVKGATE